MISQVAAFITTHGVWAAPIIGMLAFGESLAVIGLFIPATTLMIAVGGLIGTGTLNGIPVIGCAIVGAALGDWISYLMGRRVGPSIYRRWPLNRHKLAVARARLFFRRFGFATIFLGRFLGPMRAIVPLVAGVMKMPRRPFQIANVTSAVVWVPALFAPGYLAAKSMGAIELGGTEVLILAIVSLGMTVIATFIGAAVMGGRRKQGPRGTRRINAGVR